MENRFEKFSIAVLELNRYLQKIKDQEMRKFGLRSAHTMCVFYLGQHPEGLTVTQLSAICREDKAAVSRCLSQLISRGYVSGNFPENKRSYRTKLTLTDSGRELVQVIYQKADAAVTGGSSGLTQKQRDNLYAAMEIIIKNLARYIADREE